MIPVSFYVMSNLDGNRVRCCFFLAYGPPITSVKKATRLKDNLICIFSTYLQTFTQTLCRKCLQVYANDSLAFLSFTEKLYAFTKAEK